MSKKNKKEREAMHKAARRHPKNDDTPEVIPMSDQAAADPTINTEATGDVVVEETTTETPQVSYDLSGKGDDLVDDEPEPKKTNEQMALDSVQPEFEDDITFEVNFAEFTEKLKKIPEAIGSAFKYVGAKLKPANDFLVSHWVFFTDKVVEPSVDRFYKWCHEANKAISKRLPQFVTVFQLKTLTATLADVFAEVANENRTQNATVLAELAELKQQVKLLTNAVNGKHPMTIPAQSLNDLFELIRIGQKAKAATRYVQLTGSTLAVAREFVGSVSVA